MVDDLVLVVKFEYDESFSLKEKVDSIIKKMFDEIESIRIEEVKNGVPIMQKEEVFKEREEEVKPASKECTEDCSCFDECKKKEEEVKQPEPEYAPVGKKKYTEQMLLALGNKIYDLADKLTHEEGYPTEFHYALIPGRASNLKVRSLILAWQQGPKTLASVFKDIYDKAKLINDSRILSEQEKISGLATPPVSDLPIVEEKKDKEPSIAPAPGTNALGIEKIPVLEGEQRDQKICSMFYEEHLVPKKVTIDHIKAFVAKKYPEQHAQKPGNPMWFLKTASVDQMNEMINWIAEEYKLI